MCTESKPEINQSCLRDEEVGEVYLRLQLFLLSVAGVYCCFFCVCLVVVFTPRVFVDSVLLSMSFGVDLSCAVYMLL